MLGIIYGNHFENYETIISDKECLKVLSYYRIKREDAEKEIKGE